MSKQNRVTARQAPSTPRRWVRAVLVVLIIIGATFAAGAWYLTQRFDPNRYAPQLIAAVDQATGRTLQLGGPIKLHLSFAPTISVSHVSLSNPPGFPDPTFLQLGQLTAKIALLPLLSHRIEILDLVLDKPVIRLETDDTGRPSWDFSAGRTNHATPAPGPAPAQAAASAGYELALKAVDIRDGVLTIKDAKSGRDFTISLPQVTGKANSIASPLHLTASAGLGQVPVTLSGEVGPIERFTGTGTGPWPIDLTLQAGNATAKVAGHINHPRLGKGFDLSLAVDVPALEDLTRALPPNLSLETPLPPLHDVKLSTRIVDQNSTIPAIDDLSVQVGASDLSALRHGLALSALDIKMASLDKPISVDLAGTSAAGPVAVSGRFGPPQALFNPKLLPSTMPPQRNYPVSLSASAGDARLSVTGAIATPAKLAGAALVVTGSVPNLAKLTALVPSPLPKWTNIQIQTTIVDPGGLGLRHAVGFDDLAATMAGASFGGDGSLYFGPHPNLQLGLQIATIDLDALTAAWPATTAGAKTTPAAAAASPPAPSKLIGNATLPIGLLQSTSADLHLSADKIVWRGATYTALQTHAVLSGGVLKIDPLTAQLPGGSISANATLDGTKQPAVETMHLEAPALALGPLLKAFDLPSAAQGTVQLRLQASSTGQDLQGILSHLNGQLGMAMVNGILDGTVLDRLFHQVLQTVGLPASLVGAQGPVAIRCAALRIDATDGDGRIKTLTMDSSRLLLQGGGRIGLGDETLDIILRPQLKAAGSSLGLPVKIGGTFTAPTTSVAPMSAVEAAAKDATGLPVGLAQTLAGNNSLLGAADQLLGLSNGDVCPAALSLARFGQAGPSAAAPAKSGKPLINVPAVSGPQNLLNSLFGK